MSCLALLLAVSVEALILALGHLSTGLEYYRNGQQERAQREFAIVLNDYGDTSVADAALYWSAKAYEAAGNTNAAAECFAALRAKFPQSLYHAPTNQAAVVVQSPPAVTPPPANPAPAPAAAIVTNVPPPATAPASPPATETAAVVVKKLHEATVVDLDDRTFKSVAEFATALAARKQSTPTLAVKFQREPDVDLQMVIDVVNVLDRLQISYRLR